MDIRLVTTRVFAGMSALTLIAGAARAQEVRAEQARRFPIEEFRVEGNTLLPTAMIETAVTPFLGPNRTVDDVEKARTALDTLYAKQGYPTAAAEIPEQDPSDGIVVLRVTERRVGRLRVKGSRYFSLQEIRDHIPSLAEGKVPNIDDVQRDIVALNQWPDRRVTPVLRPGAAPGTVDVDLNVKDTLPLQASIELNNRQSVNTTPLRVSASVSYANLWQRGDAISLSYQLSPQMISNTAVFSTSYLYRIQNSNLSVLVSYLHSNSNVATVGSTDVLGKGDIIGSRLQIPLGTEGEFSHSIAVGADYKNFIDNVVLGASSSQTPVTYTPAVAQYQASWVGDADETLLNNSLVLGNSVYGSTTQALDQKRYQARPAFAYSRGDLTRRDDLPRGWQSWLHASGQITGDSLISNEQFAIGGMDTVRGYYEAEAIGDWGAGLQAELRSPAYERSISGSVSELRGFTFVDAARTGINNPLPQQIISYSFASTGAGVRMRLLDNFNADFVGAHVLMAGPNTHAGNNRLLFRLNGAF